MFRAISDHFSPAASAAELASTSNDELLSILRRAALHFTFDERAKRAYEQVVAALNELATSSAVWAHESTTLAMGHTRKINAGASKLVERSRVRIGVVAKMGYATCDFGIPTVIVRGQTCYFLPNGMFVEQGSQRGHVRYRDLRLSDGHDEQYIESESVPPDAEVCLPTSMAW